MLELLKGTFLEYLQSVRSTNEESYLDDEYDVKVKSFYFDNYSSTSLAQSLFSFLLAKVADQNLDIRQPLKHMSENRSYSGRLIDEKVIFPILVENGFHNVLNSCWVSQSLRQFPEISSSFYQTGNIASLRPKIAKQYQTLLELLNEVEQGNISPHRLLKSALKHYIEANRVSSIPYVLKEKLLMCIPGKKGAYVFEKIGEDIISYTFEKELVKSGRQNSTRDGKQRRDSVFRIVSNDGFWGRVQRRFNSDFIIIDYKNYTDPIDSNTLYSVSKYANEAIGKLVVIVSRHGLSSSAIDTQIRIFRDMGVIIIVLSDDDLKTLINTKDNMGQDDRPSQLLDSKLDELLLWY